MGSIQSYAETTSGNQCDDSSQKQSKDKEYNLLTEDEIKLLNDVCTAACDLLNDNAMTGNEEHIIQFWSYLANRFYEKRYDYIQLQTELERQKNDLEHFTLGEEVDSEKYNELLKEIGIVVRKRRDVKDISSYLNVAYENINKIAGFVLGMANRLYNPRSRRYGGNSESEQTTVKMDNIKPFK